MGAGRMYYSCTRDVCTVYGHAARELRRVTLDVPNRALVKRKGGARRGTGGVRQKKSRSHASSCVLVLRSCLGSCLRSSLSILCALTESRKRTRLIVGG